MQNRHELISIVIPVYNRKDLVGEAIESALAQTYPHVQVILSDNCSTDGTWEFCVSRYSANPRVLLIQNRQNLGPVANWLSAIMHAQADLIKILFSDDLLLPDCLEKMLAHLDDETAFVVSSCLVGESPGKARISFRHRRLLPGKICIGRSEQAIRSYQCHAGGRLPTSPGAALFRRSDALSSLTRSLADPASPESLSTGAGPDVMMYLDALEAHDKYVYLDSPLVFFRAHAGSLSVGDSRKPVVRGYYSTFTRYFSRRSWLYLTVYLFDHFLVETGVLLKRRIFSMMRSFSVFGLHFL